ncbi:MAG: CDP-diacylglycerol--serine O-phosphatidyltransferase [Bdellovibrionia bacterium]
MKKIYLIPNFVTTANLFCGFYSIAASIRADYVSASWAILAAGIFDMLDGRIARLAKATSQFGVEYDSLSDLISFGAAPALLLYQFALQPYDRLGFLAAFLFLACGAMRLARFNVNSAVIPKHYFQGLPIPMAAGIVSTFMIFHHTTGWPSFISPFVLILTLLLASLMVSTLRFPSLKELNWRSRSTFGYLFVGLLAMILVATRPEITLFLLGCAYVLFSLGSNAVRLLLSDEGKEKMTDPRSPTSTYVRE